MGVCGVDLSGVAPVDGAGDRTASFSMGCAAPSRDFSLHRGCVNRQ